MNVNGDVMATGPGETFRTLLTYLALGAVYVVLSVLVPELMFSWFEGVPFLIGGLWLVQRLTGQAP